MWSIMARFPCKGFRLQPGLSETKSFHFRHVHRRRSNVNLHTYFRNRAGVLHDETWIEWRRRILDLP
jgi:hypothetical protein